jgi:hypothetical protein
VVWYKSAQEYRSRRTARTVMIRSALGFILFLAQLLVGISLVGILFGYGGHVGRHGIVKLEDKPPHDKWMKKLYTPIGASQPRDDEILGMRAYGRWEYLDKADWSEDLFPRHLTNDIYQVVTIPYIQGDTHPTFKLPAMVYKENSGLEQDHYRFGTFLWEYDAQKNSYFNFMKRSGYKVTKHTADPGGLTEVDLTATTAPDLFESLFHKSNIYFVHEDASLSGVTEIADIGDENLKASVEDIDIERVVLNEFFVLNATADSGYVDKINLGKKSPDGSKNYLLQRDTTFDHVNSKAYIQTLLPAGSTGGTILASKYKVGPSTWYTFQNSDDGVNVPVPRCDSRMKSCTPCAPPTKIDVDGNFTTNVELCLTNFNILMGIGTDNKYFENCHNDKPVDGLATFSVTPRYAQLLSQLLEAGSNEVNFPSDMTLRYLVSAASSGTVIKTVDNKDYHVGQYVLNSGDSALTHDELQKLSEGTLVVKDKDAESFQICLDTNSWKEMQKTYNCAYNTGRLQYVIGHRFIKIILAAYAAYVLVYGFIGDGLLGNLFNFNKAAGGDFVLTYLAKDDVYKYAEVLRPGDGWTLPLNILGFIAIIVFVCVTTFLYGGVAGEDEATWPAFALVMTVLFVSFGASLYISRIEDDARQKNWKKNFNMFFFRPIHFLLTVLFALAIVWFVLIEIVQVNSECQWDDIPYKDIDEGANEKGLYTVWYSMYVASSVIYLVIYIVEIFYVVYKKMNSSNNEGSGDSEEDPLQTSKAYISIPTIPMTA